MAKKTYSFTVEEEIVDKTKVLQKEFMGAENISGLIEKLLKDWNTYTEEHLEYLKQPQFGFGSVGKIMRKIKKEEDSKK